MSSHDPSLAGLRETLVTAFDADPLYRWLFGQGADRAAALRANMELTLALAAERGRVDVDPHGRGLAVWTRPGVELLEDPAPFLGLLDRWAPRRRDAAVAGMVACAAHASPDDHVLHVLAVHPDHQGRGVGAEIMRPALEALDRDGASAYLESSSARNLSFYRRCGFEVLAEVPVPDRGPVMRPMRRAPRTTPATRSPVAA